VTNPLPFAYCRGRHQLFHWSGCVNRSEDMTDLASLPLEALSSRGWGWPKDVSKRSTPLLSTRRIVEWLARGNWPSSLRTLKSPLLYFNDTESLPEHTAHLF
jgi:hypothetical protein